MRCRGVQGIANAAYLEGLLFPALLRVAPYCVPGGIRMVSGGRSLLADAQELRTAMHHRTTVGLRPRDG